MRPEETTGICASRAAGTWLVATLLASLIVMSGPTVGAHGAGFEAMTWVGDQPLDIFLQGAPMPVALAPLQLRVQAPTLEGQPAVAKAEARLMSPDGAGGHGWFTLTRDGEGSFSSPVVFGEAGVWHVEVMLDGKATKVEALVHAASPYFVDAAPSTIDRGAVIAGAPETVTLRVHDARDAPAPRADDAVAQVAHLDEEGQFLGATRVRLDHVEGGEYRFSGSWPQAGTLEVSVSSPTWGLEESSRPPVRLVLADPASADVYRTGDAKETPAAGILALALALMIAVLGFRSRRR